ncbi:YadA-like family protein [Cronobacter turicensis]
MKFLKVKAAVLAVSISSLCAAYAHAAISEGERDAAMQQFMHGAEVYNSLPLTAPQNQLDDAHQEAVAGLERLGVHAGDVEDLIANYRLYHNVDTLSHGLNYSLDGAPALAPLTAARPDPVQINTRNIDRNEAQIEVTNQRLDDVAAKNNQNAVNIQKDAAEMANIASVNDSQDHVLDVHQNAIEKNTADIATIKHTDQLQQRTLTNTVSAIHNVQSDLNGIQREQANHDRTASQHVTVQNGKDADMSLVNKNTSDISSLNGVVIDNMHRITNLESGLTRTTTDTLVNAQGIKDNAAAIEKNSAHITANTSQITSNTQTIARVSQSAEGNARLLSQTANVRYQNMVNARHAAEQSALQQKIDVTAMAEAKTQAQAKMRAAVQNEAWSEQMQTLATNESTAINSNNVAIRSTSAQVDNNTQQIAKLNQNFSSLRQTVDDNRREAAAGSSSAMAMANIPQVMNSQTVAIGAGVGGYDSENAVAVGVSFRAAQNVTVKATLSDDTQQNVGYGAGMSVGW